jgi:hypothetical protein
VLEQGSGTLGPTEMPRAERHAASGALGLDGLHQGVAPRVGPLPLDDARQGSRTRVGDPFASHAMSVLALGLGAGGHGATLLHLSGSGLWQLVQRSPFAMQLEHEWA